MEDERLSLIETGIDNITFLLKETKNPVDKNSIKKLKESLSILKKKYKMLEKDEALRVQYLDRTCYDTVQGMFQAFHLYIISTDGSRDNLVVDIILTWLRTHESAYSISKRMQANAEKRADFAGTK